MVTINDNTTWIQENKKDFVPPVCNKCMFSDQLKVFFVGGPNQRKDFHLEEGEEVFYQRKGGMLLKVIEHGVHKDIQIKEGEIFMLPSRVEHSPQRYEDTIGYVVERTRKNTEFECVRYFVGDSTVRLYERWIHLTDVVKDLPPVIKGFHASEEFKNGQPGPNSFTINAPFEPQDIDFEEPINLDNFIEEHRKEINTSPVQLYGTPKFRTTVMVYGSGEHKMESEMNEIIIWTKKGVCSITVDSIIYSVKEDSMIRINPNKSVLFKVESIEGVVITIQMPTY